MAVGISIREEKEEDQSLTKWKEGGKIERWERRWGEQIEKEIPQNHHRISSESHRADVRENKIVVTVINDWVSRLPSQSSWKTIFSRSRSTEIENKHLWEGLHREITTLALNCPSPSSIGLADQGIILFR